MATRTFRFLRRTALLWVVVIVGVGGYLAVTAFADSGDRPTVDPEEEAHDHESHDHEDDALPGLDPCTLVGKAEAAAVLGPVGDVSERGFPVTEDQRVCWYSLASDEQRGAVLGITDDRAMTKLTSFDRFRPEQTEPVNGIGDAARWIAPFRTLVVVQGEWLVSVQMLAPESDSGAARAQALDFVAKALERLRDHGTEV